MAFLSTTIHWRNFLTLASTFLTGTPGTAAKTGRATESQFESARRCFSRGALPIGAQVDPPANESRYAVVGATSAGRPLFVVFALRQARIRVVSARPMTRQEKEDYDLLR